MKTFRNPNDFGKEVVARQFSLSREDSGGVVFLSCADIPELFVAVAEETQIRRAIDESLKNVFEAPNRRVQVFPNGSFAGPNIDTIVKISEY